MTKVLDITSKLPEILQKVDRPGNFATSGHFRFYPPSLVVEGVGQLALPLLPMQAKELIATAQPAPYGRGEETLVDQKVRRTWQVDAERLTIEGEGWQESLKTLMGNVKQALGVRGEVEAELYKLLIYDEGSFFIEHRDTEKRKGMFATLVIVLPCSYEGGELLVRHQREEKCFDLHAKSVDIAGYAAFFADCRHEVRPVTTGYRLTLIYNLIRTGKGPLPNPADYSQEQKQVAKLLHSWARVKQQGEAQLPEKLIYPLEHAYTPAEIAFPTLKNGDEAVAEIFTAAAAESDCEIYLALVSQEESGSAEYYGYSGGRGRYLDEVEDEDFEIIEVYDWKRRLRDWRRPDGSHPNLEELSFDEQEICPPDLFSGMEPNELNFYEASGNEGASFDRTYHFAALVLWPRGRAMAVIAHSAEFSTTIPLLDALVRQWEQAEGGVVETVHRDALELAYHIQHQWPESKWQRHSLSRQGHAARFITCLLRLGRVETVTDFIEQVVATGAYTKADNEALEQVLGQMTEPGRYELLDKLFRQNAVSSLTTCADLLRRLAYSDFIEDKTATLQNPANILVESLPKATKAKPDDYRGQSGSAISAELVADLLVAFEIIHPELGSKTVDWLLTKPDVVDMDRVLLPAALALRKLDEYHASVSVIRLNEGVINHLRQRITEPLAPPADWSRPAKLSCNCSNCKEFSRFLADVFQSEWRYKAGESRRRHLEETIHKSHCDIDCHTEKKGRPYTLVCRKNQKSYNRRVEQRKHDEAALAELEQIVAEE